MISNSQPDGGYLLKVAGRRIPFRIEFCKRKKLAISVYPELRLEVLAPIGVAKAKVLQRVNRRATWVVRQMRFFEQYHPRQPAKRYVAGETLLYRGRQYRLKVLIAADERVRLVGRYLQVWVKDRKDVRRVGRLLNDWYREQAERVINARLAECLEGYPALKRRPAPRLLIRTMKRRWGSCTKAGRLVMNRELVHMPVQCVDYVIVHELCHLQVHDHSPAFYRLLTRCLPDWERRKKRLEEFGAML